MSDEPELPLAWELDPLLAALEALLFAAAEPVNASELAAALDVPVPEVKRALTALAERLSRPDRGLELGEIAGGWQLRTRQRHATAILRLTDAKPSRLSKAALEVLAVIAYRQPCTKLEIETLRGVDSGGVLKSLLDRGIIRVAGRRDEPGKALEYRTTAAFLELFQLSDLSALPTLKERQALVRSEPQG